MSLHEKQRIIFISYVKRITTLKRKQSPKILFSPMDSSYGKLEPLTYRCRMLEKFWLKRNEKKYPACALCGE